MLPASTITKVVLMAILARAELVCDDSPCAAVLSGVDQAGALSCVGNQLELDLITFASLGRPAGGCSSTNTEPTINSTCHYDATTTVADKCR